MKTPVFRPSPVKEFEHTTYMDVFSGSVRTVLTHV
jgi:hypothetical protein